MIGVSLPRGAVRLPALVGLSGQILLSLGGVLGASVLTAGGTRVPIQWPLFTGHSVAAPTAALHGWLNRKPKRTSGFGNTEWHK
jgi:hypothetical protein